MIPKSKAVLRSAAMALALACAVPTALAQAAPGNRAAPTHSTDAKPAPARAPDEVAPGQPVSDLVIDLAGWVIATQDNRGLPFALIDKVAAQILIFDPDGKMKGMAPVLIGSAVGDTSAPGIGDRELKDIPKAERTTPAGRFLAGYGPAAGGERVLWVDYATAVSIHPMLTTPASKKEKRKERLASPEPDDNRITHGCINVSSTFYKKVISTAFKKGGVFYVLPDTMGLQDTFPGFAVPTDRIAAANVSAQSR